MVSEALIDRLRKLKYNHVDEAERAQHKGRLARLMKDISGEIIRCGSDLKYYGDRNAAGA